jgi:predicted anti-sigma-YlaC factor YlaD
MNLDHHESFQRMIDQNLAGVISREKEQSLREHLSTCASCKEYLRASNRVIAGLNGFSFEVNPTLNSRVLAALRLQMQQDRAARPNRLRFLRPYTVSLKVWAALAAALSMSIVGSALLYKMATYLMVPVHFDNAQVEAGVLVFWLLPSLCAAFCLLAAPVERRGIA